ncbi:MAG TPA: tRNA pseudouridine(38-40) synthase TruA [Thermoanaerobaculia bacterium]|nr:tRNA pseudouridine(38-40) synthase TruA [Thermoanaerobaculia bacterium]
MRLAPDAVVTAPVRYRAVVAYVGTRFHGWQAQRNAPRTVQAALEEALGRLSRERVRVEGASRTDAGVHADGQVAHFDLPRRREPRAVRDAANDALPDDVRVLAVEEVDPEFHARFDARWKEYRYRWSRSAVIAPRDAPFVAPISPRADAARMREAARSVVGTRDFRVFAVGPRTDESTVRTLHSVAIVEDGDALAALFRGDGFLRGMVRSLSGVLADVARGRVPPDRAEELLATGNRRLLSAKAPAKALTLERVSYDTGGGARRRTPSAEASGRRR